MNIEQPNIINQYNMSIEGVYRMDQNMSAYKINLRTKKWWWQLFRFVVDVAVSNAYQINYQSHINLEEYRLDALGFHRVIADAYYRQYRKSFPSTILFIDSPSLPHSANIFELDGINHWITKGSQQQHSLPGCKETLAYYCKKCNVGIHAECFALYHCKYSSL